jgi:hypothetical protein
MGIADSMSSLYGRDISRLYNVFHEQRVEVGLAVAQPAGGEGNAAVGGLDRRDIVNVGRLIWHLLNDWDGTLILNHLAEVRDFVDQPEVGQRRGDRLGPRDDHRNVSMQKCRARPAPDSVGRF